ncbi:hypothetical protein ACFWG6_31095 [Streptomyces erythrochromogenes]|uniref:hypothetical protein n=1 Tax=Streptomyces erythrochromogenes TaxID=285574 RepID=UPI003636D669
MSIEAVKWAMELAPPMPAQLVSVLTGLAYHADSKGRGSFPSVPRLAAYACKAPRQIRRDLRQLEELKLIKEGDQGKAAHLPADKRPTVYDLALEWTVAGGRAGADDQTRASARTLASSRERGRAAREAKKASSGPESTPERPDVDVRGDADVRADVDVPSDRTSTSAATGRGRPPNQLPEPSAEPKTYMSSAGSSSASQPDHHLAAFGAFWSNYPLKRSREDAKRAWIAAIERGADPQRMVDGAQAYARERCDQDPQYTKHPATWLNKGCYDDEPAPTGRPDLHVVDGRKHRPFQPNPNADYSKGFGS